MDDRQFARAISRTQLHPHHREAAYRVLVGGETAQAAAEELGLWPQAVQRSVRRVIREACPPGWVRVTVSLPPDRARQVREESEALLEQCHGD